MQLMELLDQLEEVLVGAYYVPFTNKAVVNQAVCLDLLDKVRAALPAEIAEAQRLKQARERILAQAEAEAEDMRRLGREKLEQAAAESEAVRLARVRADQIVEEGERQAREMAAAAVEYSNSVYGKLDQDLNSLLEELRYRVPQD